MDMAVTVHDGQGFLLVVFQQRGPGRSVVGLAELDSMRKVLAKALDVLEQGLPLRVVIAETREEACAVAVWAAEQQANQAN